MTGPSQQTSAREQRLQEALVEAIEAAEKGGGEERDAMIARYPDLAKELREFFANRSRVEHAAKGLPVQPFIAEAPTTGLSADADSLPALGTRIQYFGDYELLQEIGRGGMGVVYKARQVSLKRIVALKMILARELAHEEDVKRFRAEAEAAAKLDHPGIVPVFEVGQHEGHHYFTMAYVEGESLAHRLTRGLPQPRDAALLLKQVAEAVAYAHVEGVVHRDLKPANILLPACGLAEAAAKPQAAPRITDFGLAKQIERDSVLTVTGQVLGTPSYMPPEQASGKRGQVGPLSDVYSLGAVLYALLTGRPPFQAATGLDTLLQVLDQEPVPPRQLNRSIPRDLETICLKCLEKEPSRRYASARDLVADLDRYLNKQTIKARPSSRRERLVKWMRRRPAAAALLGVSVAAAIGFVVLGIALVFNAQKRELAERQRGELLRSHVYSSDLALAAVAFEKQNVHALQQDLDALRPKSGEPDLRGFEWHYLWKQINRERLSLPTMTLAGEHFDFGGSDNVDKLADRRRLVYSPDGKLLATRRNVSDAATGRVLISYDEVGGDRIFFSPDGQYACVGGKIRPLNSKERDSGTGIPLPTAPQGKELRDINNRLIFPKKPVPLGFLGKSLVVLHHVADPWVHYDDKEKKWHVDHVADTTVKSLDAATGKETVHDFQLRKGYRLLAAALCEKRGLLAVASSQPDFSESWTRKDEVEIWDLTRPGKENYRFLQFDKLNDKSSWGNEDPKALLFSPDGDTLAVVTRDDAIRLCDPASGKERLRLKPYWRRYFAFSADSKTFLALTTGESTKLEIWDVATGKELVSRDIDFAGPANSLGERPEAALSPDGKTYATGGGSRVVQLWETATGKLKATFMGHRHAIRDLVFSPDGNILATRDQEQRSPTGDSNVKLWDAAEERPIGLPVDTSAIKTFERSPDGKMVAVGFANGKIQLCAADTLKVLRTLDEKGKTTPVRVLQFSPDGKQLAASHDGDDKANNVDIWDLAEGQVIASFPGFLKAFDGKTVAAISTLTEPRSWPEPPDSITLWDIAAKTPRLEIKDSYQKLFGLSHDGKVAVSIANAEANPGGQRKLKVWSVPTGKALLSSADAFAGRGNRPAVIKFSADDKYLLIGDTNLEVPRPGVKDPDFPSAGRLYDVATGKERLLFPLEVRYGGPFGAISDWTMAEFSPDSKWLLTVANQGKGYRNKVSLWDVAAAKEAAILDNPEQLTVVHAAFSPDGKTLATLTMGEWFHGVLENGVWHPEAKGMRPMSPDSSGYAGSGKGLVSMSPVYEVHVWDLAAKERRQRFIVSWQGAVEKMAFSGDGRALYLLASSQPNIHGVPSVNRLQAWDLVTGKERGSRGDAGTRFHALAFAEDGRLLALTEQRLNVRWPEPSPSQYKVRTWDVLGGKEIAAPQVFTAPQLPLDLNPESLAASPNPPPPKEGWEEDTFSFGSHTSSALSPDGKTKAVREFRLPLQETGPDGKIKTTPSPTDVQLIDAATGDGKHVLKGYGQWVCRLAFSPDGKTLAVGEHAGKIQLWNVAAGRLLLTIAAHNGPVNGLAFRGDGRMLASCSDGEVRLWRADTNE